MSFGIGGFNPLQAVSQAALAAATGGASLIAQMAVQIASQVAKAVIQQLGQQLGLPQPMIDAAEGAFDLASGNPAGAAQAFGSAAQGAASLVAGAGESFRASPSEVGDAQRSVEQATNDLVSHLGDSQDLKGARSGGKDGAHGWLMAIASVLGEKLNVMAREMNQLAGEISKETPDKTAKFGAATQEFGILMNATNNAIKTLGESMTTTARKG